MTSPLSIAIPTYKRADKLAETLDAFLPQLLPHGVPVCISYTDDTDQTERVIAEFRKRYPYVVAVTDPDATNLDKKVVSVVSLAATKYVWLFGDDDLPAPGAVDRILETLGKRDWGVLVLNASTHDSEFRSVIEERRLRTNTDKVYAPGEHEALLDDTASAATLLSSFVFEKAIWDAVDPSEFFGTDFGHVAILRRAVVGRYAKFIADPLSRIRLGGATWASRYFEVELIQWPAVIWGLPDSAYSDAAKARVCQQKPAASLARLLATRAYGYYGAAEYRRFIAGDRTIPAWKRMVLRAPLLLPRSLAAAALVLFRRAQALRGDPKLELSLFRLRHRG